MDDLEVDVETKRVLERAAKGDLAVAMPLRAAYSDDSMARELAEEHSSSWRYVAAWGRWMIWTGSKWQEEKTLRIFERIRLNCRRDALGVLTLDLPPALTERLCVELKSRAKHVAIEATARSDRGFAAVVEDWDADRDILNTPSGQHDLRTGRSSLNDPESFCTKSTAVAAAEESDCPRWRAFLDEVTGHDHELVAYLGRLVGYCLTGQTSEHVIVFLYGTGANGKSTFISTITKMLGDYATAAPMTMFTESAFEKHPTDLAMLRGARLVTAQETEEGRHWNESLLKSLSGGDAVTARFMRQDSFTYLPQFKLLLAGNHKPALRNVDEAMRRRFHHVPFETTIPLDRRDPELGAKLEAEMPQILRWALEGQAEWRRIGLAPPAAVLDATREYLADEDSFGTWLRERTLVDRQAVTRVDGLFADYRAWAGRSGERAASNKRFSQDLMQRGFKRVRLEAGTAFEGLVLRQAAIDQ